MTIDLAKSYHDLQTKNRELEAAHNDLEDLNRHLEEKVDERTKQLRESETKFRTLFEESADAILVGTEHEFLDCNPAMLKLIGCPSKREFLNLSPVAISHETHATNKINASENLSEIYRRARNEGSHHFEWVFQKFDGVDFFAEIVMTSFTLNGNQVLHQVVRDITERKETEEKLKLAQERLVETAHSAGMAEIATGVLHNIGNILNSVNISTEEIAHTLKGSKLKGFLKVNGIIKKKMDHLGTYLSEDPKGKLIPGYYVSLGEAIEEEHCLMKEEIISLTEKVSIMRDVISTQQSYAKSSLYTEKVNITDIIEDALKLQIASLKKQGVKVTKNYVDLPAGNIPKVKLVHVLTNLIKNAKEAMATNEKDKKNQQLTITLCMIHQGIVQIKVQDNGCGITPEMQEKIFNHGFTTKPTGHGFGLHTCANFMTEMGGTLKVESDGTNCGSTFLVEFPRVCKPQVSDS